MSEPAGPDSVASSEPGRHYDLFVRRGAGLVLRLRDEGVRVESDRLAFIEGGQWQTRAYADIAEVHISSGAVPRHGVLGQCRISFRGDGQSLLVSTANARGLPDAQRRTVYTQFLRDLHGQLVASGAASRIAFRSGFSTTRYTVLVISTVLAILLFIVLPLVLLMITGEVKVLAALLFGGALLWPALKVMQKNQPGGYDPRLPPDMLA